MDWPGTPLDTPASTSTSAPWPGTPIGAPPTAEEWPGAEAAPAAASAEKPSYLASLLKSFIGQGVVGQAGVSTTGLPTVLEGLRKGGSGGFQQQMMEEQLGALPDDVQKALEEGRKTGYEAIRKGGEATTKFGQEQFPVPKEHQGLGTDVAAGLGSVVANIATGLVGGPTVAGVSALSGGAGEAIQGARAKKASPEQQELAAYFGTIPGATDLVDSMIPFFGGTGRLAALLGKVGARAFKGMAAEGIQEGGQQFLQNLIAKGIYDPKRDVMEDVPRSALVGAIVGGGTSAVLGGHGAVAPTTPATEADIRAAGAGLTAPIVAPAAAAAPQQGELPLGPPTNQLGLPLGPPLPVAEPPQVAVAAKQAAAQSATIPSASPDVVRGGPAASLFGSVFDSSGMTALGPVEGNPQTVVVQAGPQAQAGPKAQLEAQLVEDQTRIPDESLQKLSYTRTARLVPETNPTLTVGAPTNGIPIQTLHSTELKDLLPTGPVTTIGDVTVSEKITSALIQTLQKLVPNMRVHIVSRTQMDRLPNGREAAAQYRYRLAEPEPGEIFISNEQLRNPMLGAQTLLHEATHGVTSYTIRANPAVAARVRQTMDVAAAHVAKLKEVPERIANGMTNEREFIAEAFSSREMQEFLDSIPASRELRQSLGLEGKPTLWQAIKEMVRQILGLPKSKETNTLLEAVIRVGAEIIDTQAREVATMQAKFNSVEPRLMAVERQQESKGIYDTISGLGDHMPDRGTAAELQRQAGYADKMNKFYKYAIHAFQLGELNPLLVPLQRYLEKIRFAAVEEGQINDAAMRVMKDWENIGRPQGEKLTQFIDDITNMVYRTPQEVQRGVGRKPTAQEFQALAQRHGLSAEALDVFRKISTMFDQFLDKSSQLAMIEAQKITDPAQKIAAINAIVANVKNLKDRPYFPFMRYGRHVILVRNANGVVVHREHFERRGLRSAESFQKMAAEKLASQFPSPQFKIEYDLMSESSKPMIGMPGVLLDLMRQKLNLTPQQLKAFEQLRFELSPAESFKHRFQNKSYTAGYSRDFQRSFAQYFFHGAKWYVKTKYADGMREDIANVKNGINTSLTPQKRLQIHEFLSDHLENNFLDPAQDFISFKAGLVFWTLGFVPVSAVVNMSQVPMVTLPFLGAKFGDIRASGALSKAIAMWRNYYTKGAVAAMNSADMRALDYGIKSGRLEQTLGAELASWAQGGNLGVGYGGSQISRILHGAVQKSMWMFSVAEKWNRRVTYMAAYKLALSQPGNRYARDVITRYTHELQEMVRSGIPQNEAEAMLVAGHVVDQTQFQASTESRPRMMRGKFGTLLLYKRYMQGLLFLTGNNKRDFGPRFVVMALLMGGLSGLPGYDDVKEIARALAYQLFGKDFSLDREIRALLKEMGAEHWAADQTLHGLARIGFGVPWLLNMMGSAMGQKPTVNAQSGAPQGPDLSKSIGLGGPVLPMEVGKMFGPPIKDPSEIFGEQGARLGGVGGQLASSFYKAMVSKDSPTDFKRWESMMPRAAKDLSQAYRAFSEEKLRGAHDTAVVRFDTRDPEHLGEILGIAGGFQPRRLTAKWDELRDQSEAVKFYDVQRSMLLEQWAAAIRAGSQPQEIEKMQTATNDFNAALPSYAKGNAILPKTIKESVGTKLRVQQLQEGGFAARKKDIPIIQYIQSLHPESTVDVRRAVK